MALSPAVIRLDITTLWELRKVNIYVGSNSLQRILVTCKVLLGNNRLIYLSGCYLHKIVDCKLTLLSGQLLIVEFVPEN